MSSFNEKAKCLKTGDIVNISCIDDFFGNRIWGYLIGDTSAVLDIEEFNKKYEWVKK